jgi:hypothetical protein
MSVIGSLRLFFEDRTVSATQLAVVKKAAWQRFLGKRQAMLDFFEKAVAGSERNRFEFKMLLRDEASLTRGRPQAT